jgi:hypothetical protein
MDYFSSNRSGGGVLLVVLDTRLFFNAQLVLDYKHTSIIESIWDDSEIRVKPTARGQWCLNLRFGANGQDLNP